MIRRVCGLIVVAAALTTGYAQTSEQVTKANALKKVGVTSLPGWSEVLSDKNKFRVLFPGQPQVDDDVISMPGFRLTNASGKWSVFCADLRGNVPKDESSLRDLYQRSMDSMTHNKTFLLASQDVFLNGRLGIEFRIRGLAQTSYTRAFASSRSLYTLSVSRKNPKNPEADTPQDVQQFFDSFAYWD